MLNRSVSLLTLNAWCMIGCGGGSVQWLTFLSLTFNSVMFTVW